MRTSDTVGAWAFGTGTLADTEVPGAVTGLAVAAGAGGLRASWTAPATGGLVRGYDVHYTSAAVADVPNDAAPGTSSSTHWAPASRPGTATNVWQLIAGLTDGTLYRVRVRAKNGAGAGAWEFGTGTPSSSAAPAAPHPFDVSADHQTLNLSWFPPAGTVTGYDVHYTSAPKTGAGAVLDDADLATDGNAATGWKDAGHTGTGRTQAIAGLTNGTAYRVRVRAKNANGAGAWAHKTGAPVPVMGFLDFSEVEPEGGSDTITVKLSSALSVETTVTVAVVPDKPASGRAEEGDDFTLSTRTLTFPAGTTEKTFTVSTVADRTTEGEEVFHLRLAAPDGAPYRVRELSSPRLYDDVEFVILDASTSPGLTIRAADTVQEGGSIVLQFFLGSPAPENGATVTLSLGGTGTATEGTDFRLSTKTVIIPEGEIHLLDPLPTLEALDDDADDDGETVVLNASSTNPAFTATARTVRIVDTDVPASTAPQNVQAAAGADGTLTVTWDAPPAAVAGDPNYLVYLDRRKKDPGGAWSNLVVIGRYANDERKANRSVTLRGLAPATHEVRLRFFYHAETDPVAAPGVLLLSSVFSAAATAEGTVPVIAPTAPRNVRIVPGDDKVTLFWQAPANWGNFGPQGYEFDIVLNTTCDQNNVCTRRWGSAGIAGPAATSFVRNKALRQNTFEVAKNGQLTTMRIRAVTLRPGAVPGGGGVYRDTDYRYSPWSDEVSATPMAGLSDTPTSLVLSGSAAGNRVGEGEGAVTLTVTQNSLSATATAVTLSIDGGASTATETADFTLSPKTVTIAAGERSATATLTIVDDTDVETSEAVSIGATAGDLTASALAITIVDNDVTVDPPTGLTVTAGDGTLTLAWTAPSGTLTGYDVEYKEGAAADAPATTEGDPATGWVAVSRSGTAASQAISGLTNGVDHDLRVRATAAGGNVSRWAPAAGTPGTLTALATPANFALTPGDREIAASWDAAANADRYVVLYGVAGSGSFRRANAGGALSHTVTGLVNGTDYVLSVQAKDTTGSYGPSPQHAWVVATPGVSMSADAGLSSLTARAAAAADGAYEALTLSNSGGGYSATVPRGTTHVKLTPTAAHAAATMTVNGAAVPSGSSSAPIQLAASGETAVTVRVTAEDGETVKEYAVTLAQLAPGQPAGLVVTPGTTGLDLRWTAPPETAVAGYDVHYTSAGDWLGREDARASGSALVSHAWMDAGHTGTAASHAITGLSLGIAYRVRVRAVYVGGGTSDWLFGTGTPTTALIMTAAGGTTVSEGNEVEVTIRVRDPGLIPAGGDGWWVRVTSAGGTAVARTGFAEETPANWDYWLYDGQGEWEFLNGDESQRHQWLAAYLNFTPTAPEHTVRIVVRADGVSEGDETIVLDAREASVQGLDSRWLSQTLTLTIRGDGEGTVQASEGEEVAEPVGTGPYAALIARMYGWRNDPAFAGNKQYTDLWDRALKAFGETVADDSLAPMTADEALRYADAGLEGWAEVAAALRELESTSGEPVQTALGAFEPPPVVTIAAGSPVTEGAAAGFTLTAAPAPASDLSVSVTVSERGAFAQASALGARTVTIPAGQTTASFTVATVDDNVDEADGAVAAALGAGTGYAVGAAASASVAVADNDVPVVTIAAGSPVTEGTAAGFTLTAAPVPASDLAVKVTVSQSGAFAEASALGARTVTIPAGQATASFAVATVDDAVDEPDGAVVALLGSGDGYTVGDAARASVAVADDDEPPPGIVTERSIAKEGKDEAVVFTVLLDRAASETVTVDYATADGKVLWMGSATPATAGADYTATTGTLSFAAGETLKTVSVPLLDDAIDEGVEYFWLRFSNPQGAGAVLEAAHRETVGLIVNDDHLQAMWLARFGRTVASQITDAVSDRLGAGLAPGAHVTLAGQKLDLLQAADGEALAEAMTGLARAFGAQDAPANDDPGSGSGAGPGSQSGAGGAGDSFAVHRRPGEAWNGPAAATTAPAPAGREVLLGSAFHVARANEGSGPALAAWGRVAHGSFDGEHEDDEGTTRVDGEVLTGVLGADAEWNRVLLGVAVSLSEGEGKYDAPEVDKGQSGKIESSMTTVSPYARLKITERVSAWGLAGWGTGDMTIRFDDGSMAPIRTDLSMQLGAVGARGELLTQGEAGLMDLALKADAFLVRTKSERAANSAETEADASRLRLVLEGGRRFALSETATLRPSLELGVRQDGGDAETGTGVELGGGVSWRDAASGLSIEAKGRMLVAHADSDYEEWGASATARLDPGERGRGLSFSLAPSIGATSSAAQRLWGAQDARALAPGGEFEAARGLTAEAGYGMALFGDRFTGTPNVGFGMSDGGARDYRIGWRLTSVVRGDPGFEVNLDATRREAANANEPPEHGVMLRSLIRW